MGEKNVLNIVELKSKSLAVRRTRNVRIKAVRRNWSQAIPFGVLNLKTQLRGCTIDMRTGLEPRLKQQVKSGTQT